MLLNPLPRAENQSRSVGEVVVASGGAWRAPAGRGRPRTRPDRIRGDKAYACAGSRALLRRRGIRVTIPDKKNHRANRLKKGSASGRPPKVDCEDYKKRHAVECVFNRLKRWRAVATRFDKLAVRYETTVTIAVIDDWAQALVKAVWGQASWGLWSSTPTPRAAPACRTRPAPI